MSIVERRPLVSKKNNKNSFDRKVIVISGPTAVGKTKLSLIIAQAVGGEIISADSMQVYRGMDIGTSKPKLEERGDIIHHLIDSKDLDENATVMDFYHEALSSIEEIFQRGHIPIVVGGTGFYIHALINGPPQGPAPSAEIRKRLEDEIEKVGPELVYQRLKDLDPIYAATITANDKHKIVRALEIIELSGRRVSDFANKSEDKLFDFRCWFIHLPREKLYKKIDDRCDEMLKNGFIDEVKKLKEEGLLKNKSAANAIGYKQCLDYLNSEQTQEDYEKFVQAFKQASRKYAKRQFTWFKKEIPFKWLDINNLSLEWVAEIIIQDIERH